ncbi:hypothetical protein Q5P01_015725 [Channa striata]|uniref:Uncharacterized protein n=1 Tax=Channa striata TaxID=64152 RepID=A0AA88SFJ7_CHASR|nr:hypothetical protein Q5P01_015725 [Channa striata]
MDPTRTAARQRLWRCPACALWIALLLHRVADLSASGSEFAQDPSVLGATSWNGSNNGPFFIRLEAP